MYIRIIIFLLILPASAFAQRSFEEQSYHKILDEELAKRSNGKWLFARSEIYRRTVLKHIEEKLKLSKSLQADQSQSEPEIFSGDVSNDAFGQEETSLAISKTKPNLICIASNDEIEDVRSMPIYLTTDGGKSWNTSRMPSAPKPYYAYGDPFLASDQLGGFYYANLIYNDQAGLSNILVQHSSDGLLWTYNNPVILNKAAGMGTEDKESITVDLSPSSLTYGRVYISWMHFNNDSSKTRLLLAWSDNMGQSWSNPVVIDSTDGFFSQVKVNRNGDVFYTYSQYRDDGSKGEHYLLVSHDYGISFTRNKIAEYYNYPYSNKEYVPTLKGENGIRAFPYITMDYDNVRDKLHVIYGTYKAWDETGSSSAVLYYTNTTDGGISWKEPVAIGFQGDSSTLYLDHFMPWIAFDENNNSVRIIYYSSQDDPENIKVAAYNALIDSSGKINYTKLSDSLFNPLEVTDYISPFIGDYTACTMSGSLFASAWTENRKGYSDGEIYAYVANMQSGVGEMHQVSSKSLQIYSLYPNPIISGKLMLGFAIPRSSSVSISLFSTTGILNKRLFQSNLSSGTYEKEFDVNGITSGSYILSLETEYGTVQKEIIVLH